MDKSKGGSYEARRKQSQLEAFSLKLYAEKRRIHHHHDALNESGWIGEIFNTKEGKVLLNLFGNIDVSELNSAQKKTLELDILRISTVNMRKEKQRAKQDLKATTDAIKQIKKQQKAVESLNRSFRSLTHFSPFVTPDVTLATLLFELSENQRAIHETLSNIGYDKSNPDPIYLCSIAVDIFLRWYDDDTPEQARGISYSPDYNTLKNLADNESKDIHTSVLKDFLKNLKDDMVSAGITAWDFGIIEPSRIAAAQHKKNPKYVETE